MSDKIECLTLTDPDGSNPRDYAIEDFFQLGEQNYLVLRRLDADQTTVVRYDIANETVEEITDDAEWNTVEAHINSKE